MFEGLLAQLVLACAGFALVCWVLSEVTREYSWVDRLWSVVPPLYVGWIAWSAGFADLRLDLMFALCALWGARLTFNYWRKGGYARGGEDYRWAVLRERLGPTRFALFNATFVSPYQNLLLLLIALPAYAASQHDAPIGPLDAALAVLFLGFLAGETVADQQQWDFQSAKKAAFARGETPSEQFATRGLWRWSRHPNFFCELGQWWTFYGFAAVASGQVLHWTIVGPALLTLLFDGSTRFTESLTLAKYPEYAARQRTTSRWIPWPPRV